MLPYVLVAEANYPRSSARLLVKYGVGQYSVGQCVEMCLKLGQS